MTTWPLGPTRWVILASITSEPSPPLPGRDGAFRGVPLADGWSPEAYVFRHARLLGTMVEVRLDAESVAVARAADPIVTNEIDRLERVFSAFDPSSELRTWARGETTAPGPELTELLLLALEWQ